MYSLDIRTKDGFTFANKDNIVNVNGKRVNSSNADKTPAGLFVVAINSITPKASEIENPDQPDQPSKPEQSGKPADGSENKPSSPSTETKRRAKQRRITKKQKRKILFKPVKLLTWFNGYL